MAKPFLEYTAFILNQSAKLNRGAEASRGGGALRSRYNGVKFAENHFNLNSIC